MDVVSPHAWDLSPTQAVALQKDLRSRVRLVPYAGEPRLVAGADVSFNKYSPMIYAGVVVLDYQTLEIVARAEAVREVDFPYVPGLLSFREIPALIDAFKKLEIEPDIFFFDGQGIAHPRRLGIASHMGLVLQKPSIGVAKSVLVGRFAEPGRRAGDLSPLVDRGEVVGVALRTKKNVNPVFVSPGHLIDLESSVRLVSRTAAGYRIPEPTRQAHLFVNEVRRRFLQ